MSRFLVLVPASQRFRFVIDFGHRVEERSIESPVLRVDQACFFDTQGLAQSDVVAPKEMLSVPQGRFFLEDHAEPYCPRQSHPLSGAAPPHYPLGSVGYEGF